MEEGAKKLVMIIIVIACLGAAGAITVMTRDKSEGVEGLDPTEMIWVKCSNEDCEAEYEVSKKDYYTYMQENRDPMSMLPPPMRCKECGEESCLQAIKCESCGLLFFKGTVPHDFADRCPECKFSKTEQVRKERARQK